MSTRKRHRAEERVREGQMGMRFADNNERKAEGIFTDQNLIMPSFSYHNF